MKFYVTTEIVVEAANPTAAEMTVIRSILPMRQNKQALAVVTSHVEPSADYMKDTVAYLEDGDDS